MNRGQRFVVVVVLASMAIVGCGDNSRQCGPGTKDLDGVCTADDGGPDSICGDGTILSELTGNCEIDPATCGDGTVLIDGKCQDPAAGLMVDLEEGPEPNGFEPAATPAGVIALKTPGGSGFVIHGCIQPIDDAADFDVYTMTVTGPTLIKIAADGVSGLAAGFIAFGDAANPLLADWVRLGINIATDTSKRELLLPAAGSYLVVMADTRTLLPITSGGSDVPAAGNPDGTSCYYATIDQRSLAAPASLDLVAGATGTIGEDLKFFTAAFPTGFTRIDAVVDPSDTDGDGIPDITSHAAPALVVLNNTSLRQLNDAFASRDLDDSVDVARATIGGIKAGDDPLVVLDYVWNFTISPADFAIRIDASLTSQALSTTGGSINAASKARAFVVGGEEVLANLNLFHFDVDAAGDTHGLDLVFSKQVQGVVKDGDFQTVSPFTGLVGDATSSTTFAAYQGLMRFATPGRYYFSVFLPRDASPASFTVQSTITAQIPAVLTLDTPLANQPVNAFNSNAHSYDAGTLEPWQLWNATGTSTGLVITEVYSPAELGAGAPRMDTLAIRTGGGAGVASSRAGDLVPLDALAFAANGSTPQGAILFAEPTSFFVKVNPTVKTGAGRVFTLDFATRAYHDFNTIDAGTIQTVNNEPLDQVTNPRRRYYFETSQNNIVTLTVTPNTATLDAALGLFDRRETETAIDANPANGVETVAFTQRSTGFTAFQVRSKTAVPLVGTNNFTVTAKVDPPFYKIASSTTGFSDACAGGVARPFTSGDADEGLTATVLTPVGFVFYGQALVSFVISSNGFLSFDTSITDPNPFPEELPDGLGETHVAPLWDDLVISSLCTKLTGTKLTIQWVGEEFSVFGGGASVAFQAILDSSDDSIEFVWGDQQADGTLGVSGVQNLAGNRATTVGQRSPFVAPNTSKKLSP